MADPDSLPRVGWREWVGLPVLGLPLIKCKVDTGARTSALHAMNMREELDGGVRIVTFQVQPLRRRKEIIHDTQAELVEYRNVRSSDGKVQRRPIITTPIYWNDQTFEIELSLTTRSDMLFGMLLGRTAVRGRFLVDPQKSYLSGEPSAEEIEDQYQDWLPSSGPDETPTAS